MATRDFRMGCGLQYTFILMRVNIYGLTDLAYRLVRSEGNFFGGYTGVSSRYVAFTYGFDAYAGLGFRIRILRRFFISPEFCYNLAMGWGRRRTLYLNSNAKFISGSTDGNANPVFRLHATIGF